MKPGTSKPELLSTFASIAAALGCAGICMILGFLAGAIVPESGGSSSGWYDTRGLNAFLACMFGSCVGFFGGLIGGWHLGRLLARRWPQYALFISGGTLLLPVLYWAIVSHNMVVAQQRTAATYARLAQEDSARQIAQRDQYLASPQYAEVVQKDLNQLDIFKAQMGPITYPNSVLASSPSPRFLIFETDDSVAQIRDFFKTAPVTMGYFDNGPTYGYAYWKLGDMKGSIYISGKQGSAHTKSIAYNIE